MRKAGLIARRTASKVCLFALLIVVASLSFAPVTRSPVTEWDVVLTASLGTYNDVSEFGVRNDATSGFDTAYDALEPPEPPGSGVISYFWYPDNPTSPVDMRKLSTSKITSTPPMTWTYVVRGKAVSGTMTISWSAEDIDAIPGNYEVYLYCPDTSVIDMRDQVEYSFSAESDVEYTFIIQVEPCAYLVVRGLDNCIYYRGYDSSIDEWGVWNVLPGATCDSPAAAVCCGKLHIVVRGLDGYSLWYSSVDLSTKDFSGWALLPGSTPSAPTLTSNGTAVCLVARGWDNRVYYGRIVCDGSWSSWHVIPEGATCDSPAAALLGSDLHIVVRGMDEFSLWYGYVDLETSAFHGWDPITGATPSRPALTASQSTEKLHLVVRGLDDRIYCREYDASTESWGEWSAISSGATCDGPDATVLDGKLHLIVRGMDECSLWHGYVDVATDDFSGWAWLNGATESAPTLAS